MGFSSPLSITGAIPNASPTTGTASFVVCLTGAGSIPDVRSSAGVTVSLAALASTGTLPAVLVSQRCTIAPASLTSAGTIPTASGIGIRPAPPGPVEVSRPLRGASVSFDDFTLGWAELHRFMGVNEQATAMPPMNFEASGTTVRAWTGGQYVGPCIPGFGTADLATAWETAESGTGGNYAY